MKWTPCLFIMLFLVFVQHISLAAPAVTNLPENRIILFDDYVLTNNVPPTWVHEGPTPMGLGGTRALLAGTNHYHRTGWVLRSCRTGCSGYMVNARIIPPKSPATIPAAPYIALNLAANLQNDPGAMIESPVFTNGIGTIYFEAINGLAAFQTTVSVEVATSMTNRSIGTVIGTVNPSSTNGFDYIWRNLDTLSLNAATSNDFTRYSKLLNYRQSVKLRMRRIGDAYGGIGGADNAFTVIDNIRISQPPADVTVSGTAAFNLNGNGIIRCFVSNVDTNAPAAPRTVTGYYRRLNLLPPDNAWTNAPMSLADAGDGNGNNERYEVMLPIQLLGTNLEYYVVCSFGGYWYQSPDYTGLGYTGYPSELRSPFTTAHQTNNPAAMDVYALTVNGGTGGGLYTYGSPITVTATTLVGNTFARWTGATQYIASAISATTTVTMPAQDVILTAVFAASSFMVTFDPAGGTVNPANKSVTFNAVYGDLPDPLKTGYTFSGWRANTNGVIFGVTSNTVVAVAADHTLTADWTANAYTVTFNPQGGTVDPTNKVVTFDAQYGDLPEPTRTGYTFTGWRESTNGIVFGVASNTLVSVASDHTLSASWSANTYTVAFDADGGTVDPTNKVVTFDAVYGVMPDPARIGYTFSGWKENTNGIVFGVTSNTVVAVAADHTLIANWSANTYTVTFNPQGGTVNPANKAVTFDAIYGELPDPAKTGYTFTGWKANTNGVFFKVTSNTVVAVASDHALTANWSANNYTATFDPQGGTVNPTNKIVTYDVAYGELPDPARTGYTFTGWMAATNGARFVVSSNSVVSIASDHALTAVWTANTYTVTFDAQGGAVTPASGAAIFDSVYGGLPVPVLSGHTFGGWWTGPGGTGMRVTDATVVATAAEHTLYAKWTATVYTVTFDPAGGTVSPVTKTVTYGGPYGDLPVPALAGFTFNGWWTAAGSAGLRVTAASVVTNLADLTLSARYFQNPVVAKRSPLADPAPIKEGVSVSFSVTAGDGTDPDTATRGMSNIVWFVDGVKMLETRTGAPNAVTSAYTLKTYTNTVQGAAFRDIIVIAAAYDRQGCLSDSSWTVRVVNVPVAQTIKLQSPGTMVLGDGDFVPNASASSGLQIVLASSNESVARIVDGLIHIVGAGTAVITASQPGNFDYKAATPVKQTLTVKARLTAEVSDGAGTVTGAGLYLPGAKVALSAKPNANNTFLHWEDGSQATARSLVMPNANTTVSAWFGITTNIQPPVVAEQGPLRAMVGVAFTQRLDITSESLPTVTVTGLPAGLGYSAATMMIAGVPTVSVTNKPVSIKAVNVNKTPGTNTFFMTVDPLPAWAVGMFDGAAGTAALGSGSASMSVTPLGAASGKMTLRGTNFSFSAKSFTSRDVDGSFTLVTTASVGNISWPLTLTLNLPEVTDTTGVVSPTLSEAVGALAADGGMTLYRDVWNDPGMVTVLTNTWAGYYTATLPGGPEYGSGYLTFTVDRLGGVKTVGKLADGTAVSLSGTLILDEAGRAFTVLYSAPTAYKGGGIFGLAEFFKSGDGAKVIVRLLDGEPFLWESLNPTATQAYGAGFSRELGLSGGWYDTVGNLYRYYSNSVLQAIADAGAPVPEIWVGTNRCGSVCWDPDGLALTVVTNRGGVMTGLAAPKAGTPVKVGTNVYDYAGATNATGLTVGLTRATGVFKGTFKAWFDYAAAHTPRTISYEGVLTPEREDPDDGIAGRGFFVWPDSAKYPNPQGKPVPYNFNWSYDFKILLSDSLRLFLSGPDNGRAVSLGAGSVLQVELPGNPSTGYAWEVDSYDPAVLTDVYEHYEPDYHGPGMTGGGGVYTFRFYAAATGESPLRLVYVGPPGPGFPADTFEVQATVR